MHLNVYKHNRIMAHEAVIICIKNFEIYYRIKQLYDKIVKKADQSLKF